MKATLRDIDLIANEFWQLFKTDPGVAIVTLVLVCFAYPLGHSVDRGYTYQKEVTIE